MQDGKENFYNPVLLYRITIILTAANEDKTVDNITLLINNDTLQKTELKRLRLRVHLTLMTLFKNNNVVRSLKKTNKGTAFYYKIKN
jgi:hypothetical protein